MALPNLPIPRELRDQIYGYLLDSAYTRVTRYPNGFNDTQDSTTCQSYKFHTHILAVNRTVHDEAQEYLYKNNKFIVASIDWPDFIQERQGKAVVEMVWSRFVNAKHVAKMRHHTVRLHLAMNKQTSTNVTGAGGKAQLQSFLLLAKDLGAFCTTLQFQLKASAPGFVIVIGDSGHDPQDIIEVGGVSETDARISKPPSLKIEFRDTQFYKATDEWQRQLLDMLSEVASPSMKVGISGNLRIEESGYIQQLKAKMGPVLYSRCADSWVRFQTLCKAKLSADEALNSGELHLAAHMYTRIVKFARLPLTDRPSSRVARESIFGLLFDVLCTLGYLQIKLKDLKSLVKTAEYLMIWMNAKLAAKSPDSPRGIVYPDGAEAHCRYLGIASNMLLRDYSTRASELTMSVSRIREIYSQPAFQGNAYAMHDLAIIQKVSNPKDSAFHHLPLNRCGAYKLPILPLKLYLDNNVPKKPDYIVGLQNLDTLCRLSEGTKTQINAIQRVYRQPLTKWD
jgi:hypothetical protein